jgi:hypothetical protein
VAAFYLAPNNSAIMTELMTHGCVTGSVLMSVGIPCFASAAGIGARLGIWAALPLIPLVWLALGFGLCFACVLTKRMIGPRLSPRHPIKMFSGDFARWWLVGAWTSSIDLNLKLNSQKRSTHLSGSAPVHAGVDIKNGKFLVLIKASRTCS